MRAAPCVSRRLSSTNGASRASEAQSAARQTRTRCWVVGFFQRRPRPRPSTPYATRRRLRHASRSNALGDALDEALSTLLSEEGASRARRSSPPILRRSGVLSSIDTLKPHGAPPQPLRPPGPQRAARRRDAAAATNAAASEMPHGVPRPLQRTRPPDAAATWSQFPLGPAGDAS